MATPATAKAKELTRNRNGSNLLKHFKWDGPPTTDILKRIKEATPSRGVLANVTITVAIAQDLMTINANRPLRMNRYLRWAKIMSEDKWLPSTDGIGVTKDMELYNGQHRLMAIIESGKPQVFTIFCGLPPETKNVTDTGEIRTAADILDDLGFKYPTTMAAAIKMEIYLRKKNTYGAYLFQDKVNNYEVEEWVEELRWTKLMNECVEHAFKELHPKQDFLAQASWSFIYFITSQRHRGDATYFVDKLASGESMSSRGKDWAIYRLRETLTKISKTKDPKLIAKNGAPKIFALKMWYIITAWNLWRSEAKPMEELPAYVKEKDIPRPR